MQTLLIILATIFICLAVVAFIAKPGSIYASEPEQKNPMEGKQVVFVEDESDPENADGVRGHLEAVGTTNHRGGLYERVLKTVFAVSL